MRLYCLDLQIMNWVKWNIMEYISPNPSLFVPSDLKCMQWNEIFLIKYPNNRVWSILYSASLNPNITLDSRIRSSLLTNKTIILPLTSSFEFFKPLNPLIWTSHIELVLFDPESAPLWLQYIFHFGCENGCDTSVSWMSHIAWKSRDWALYKWEDHTPNVLRFLVNMWCVSHMCGCSWPNMNVLSHDPSVVSELMVRVRD